MATVTLEIPQDVIDAAHLSVSDIKLELALALYSQQRLSLGKAHELAGLSLWQFRQHAAERGISPHADESTLADDLETLKTLDTQ